MKIERPLWYLWFGISGGHHDDADEWFDTHVEPINKMLDEAVEVYGMKAHGGNIWATKQHEDDSKKALLINIQPIKQETAEDVLRDWMKIIRGGSSWHAEKEIERAKAVLERDDG